MRNFRELASSGSEVFRACRIFNPLLLRLSKLAVVFRPIAAHSGYVTAEITDKLRKEGPWGADINVDGWLRLPHVRFSDTHPGRDSQPPQESLFSDYNTFAIVGSIKS